MKSLLAVGLSLAMAAGCSPSGATAQAGHADWADPTGRVSWNFASNGWRPISPLRKEGEVFEIASPKDGVGGRTVMCSVMTPRSGGVMGGSQAQINAYMDRQDETALPSQWTGAEGFELLHRSVDGVSVIDLHFIRSNYYQRWRMFRLPATIGTTQYTLGCGADGTVSQADKDEIERVITSIHIAAGS